MVDSKDMGGTNMNETDGHDEVSIRVTMKLIKEDAQGRDFLSMMNHFDNAALGYVAAMLKSLSENDGPLSEKNRKLLAELAPMLSSSYHHKVSKSPEKQPHS